MPQTANIYRVLIASPGDCVHERELIPRVISAWNSAHSRDESAIVETVMWETHTRPSLDGRPQEVINKQIVEGCDFVIGVFWTRLGTPTGISESGTAEEIEIFRSIGKPVLLYFSSVPANLNFIDIKQYNSLVDYKDSLRNTGLYSQYNSLENLKEQLQRHLASVMIDLLRGQSKDTAYLKSTQSTSATNPISPVKTLAKADDFPIRRHDSVEFFAHRLSKAFPGVRGEKWFNDPSVAVERLMILLKGPLKFKALFDSRIGNETFEGTATPIWWFRAGSSMMIENAKQLSDSKILINNEELEIKRVGVFESPRSYQCFVYIEAKGEYQTGLYNYSDEELRDQCSVFGYADEEFALLDNGQPIKRTEYDDGAAVINGKVIEFDSAELRVRFLTDYNMIICANDAPFNSNKFDKESTGILNGILNGSQTSKELFDWMMTFRKHEE